MQHWTVAVLSPSKLLWRVDGLEQSGVGNIAICRGNGQHGDIRTSQDWAGSWTASGEIIDTNQFDF